MKLLFFFPEGNHLFSWVHEILQNFWSTLWVQSVSIVNDHIQCLRMLNEKNVQENHFVSNGNLNILFSCLNFCLLENQTQD